MSLRSANSTLSSAVQSAAPPKTTIPLPSRRKYSIPHTSTSHPDDPIPKEPITLPDIQIPSSMTTRSSPPESEGSAVFSDDEDEGTSGSELSSTSPTSTKLEKTLDKIQDIASEPKPDHHERRGSTVLISKNAEDVKRILGANKPGIQQIQKVCCGEGCCFLNPLPDNSMSESFRPVTIPNNQAFNALKVTIGPLSLDSQLTSVTPLPTQTATFVNTVPAGSPVTGSGQHPPKFVMPHPPYEVFSSKIWHTRELTKPGAEKRTYHFELDITDYPEESGQVDFVVGGAIGFCPRNLEAVVDEIFNLLGTPTFVRDKPVSLKTSTGRWPTIWGDDMTRELTTTRRELLAWCSDVQSYPPNKPLLRLLAEYASDESEKKILTFLTSAQGQTAFCDLRTNQHITLLQLLHAFPSSRPPLDHLLSVLNQLMPRFYSLSQDPQISCERLGKTCRRLIEVAVTVHETENYTGEKRTGVSSGYLESLAKQFIEYEKSGKDPHELDLRVPIFRGLMSNPLAREFVSDGPMLLIGAGVGIAPFRGFVQRRLRSANCANKVWVLQGIRDSLVDELYEGEWGVHEDKVKKIVQSRRGEKRYVQEEVRVQADLVWFIINALDGRVFVCGSSAGMGEGVEAALIDVAMAKGNLNLEEATKFWQQKKETGQYIAVSLFL
ncbi:MAG: hypothetical protein M1834_000655 [Cirrosporium novae-zelandiae]|nr:MAG: hypothetical protein M1834_000655 [Cirrosporium novae-zelandiae]